MDKRSPGGLHFMGVIKNRTQLGNWTTNFQLVKCKSFSHVWLLQPVDYRVPWNFPGGNAGVGNCFLLQESSQPETGLRQILTIWNLSGKPFSTKENEKGLLTFKKEVMRKAWLVHKLVHKSFWCSSRPWEHWTQSPAYILSTLCARKAGMRGNAFESPRMLLHFLGHENWWNLSHCKQIGYDSLGSVQKESWFLSYSKL